MQIEAANGQRFPAFTAVSMTLKFFKDHALRELSNQCGTTIDNDDVRWIITVPAIWNEQAKKFMRLAAYEVATHLCRVYTRTLVARKHVSRTSNLYPDTCRQIQVARSGYL